MVLLEPAFPKQDMGERLVGGTKAEASTALGRVSLIAVVSRQHGVGDGARWPLTMLLELGKVGKCQRFV